VNKILRKGAVFGWLGVSLAMVFTAAGHAASNRSLQSSPAPSGSRPAQTMLLLHNGDRLTGTLLQQDEQQFVLQLPYAGAVSIQRQAVQRVSTVAAPLPAKTIAADTAPIAAELASLSSHYDLDLSASNRHGKQQAESYSVQSSNEWRLAPWRWSVDGKFDYEIKETARKTHQYQLNPGLDYFYNDSLFGRLKLDYSYNYLASDYKNRDWAAGPGLSFFRDNEDIRLELMLLLGLKQAYFRGDLFLQGLLNGQDKVDFRFASVEWDHYYRFSQPKFEVYSTGTLLKMLNQPLALLDFRYELNATVGVRYWLNQQIRLSWSLEYDRTALDLILTGLPEIPLDVQDVRQKLSIGARF
jgi:hypothetical protein